MLQLDNIYSLFSWFLALCNFKFISQIYVVTIQDKSCASLLKLLVITYQIALRFGLFDSSFPFHRMDLLLYINVEENNWCQAIAKTDTLYGIFYRRGIRYNIAELSAIYARKADEFIHYSSFDYV